VNICFNITRRRQAINGDNDAVEADAGWFNRIMRFRGFTETVDHLAMGVGEKGEDMALGSNQPTVRECLDNIDCYGYEIPSYPGSFDDRIGY